MALCKLSKNIRRYLILNTQRKRIEKEEEALKDFFRQESGGLDTVFQYKDIEVPVTTESRTSIDTKALRAELGDLVAKYEKTTQTQRVSVRKKEKTA